MTEIELVRQVLVIFAADIDPDLVSLLSLEVSPGRACLVVIEAVEADTKRTTVIRALPKP